MQSQRGFSLVELVVATAVLATAAVSIVIAFTNITKLNRQSRNLTIANQYAQQRMEEYRNTSFSNIELGTVDFTSSLPRELKTPNHGEARVTDADPNADPPDPIKLKRVEIDIDYTDGSTTKRVRLVTLVAERGINR